MTFYGFIYELLNTEITVLMRFQNQSTKQLQILNFYLFYYFRFNCNIYTTTSLRVQ